MTKIQDQTDGMELVVGKKYRNKHNVDRIATILYVGEFQVFYRLEYQDDEQIRKENTLGFRAFREHYEEIPKWKPEVGKKAWCQARREYVEIICIHGGQAFCIPDNLDEAVVLSAHLLLETDPDNK